eukprot:m.538283 g.538283  ORF g.538283 m.538283 type:complete len:1088 (+) comp22081_c0_seq2:227-3490(+)
MDALQASRCATCIDIAVRISGDASTQIKDDYIHICGCGVNKSTSRTCCGCGQCTFDGLNTASLAITTWNPTFEFIVGGMTCESCISQVLRSIFGCKDVLAAAVHLDSGSVHVQIGLDQENNFVFAERLRESIEDLGFTVTTVSPSVQNLSDSKNAPRECLQSTSSENGLNNVLSDTGASFDSQLHFTNGDVATQATHTSDTDSTISTFDVDGMSCTACTTTIERIVGKIRGVSRVSASLIMNTAVIHHNLSVVSEESLRSAIEDLGFTASLRDNTSGYRLTLTLRGDVALAMRKIQSINGVTEVEVVRNQQGQLSVVYDGARVKKRDIVQHIDSPECCVVSINTSYTEGRQAARQHELREMRRLLLISLVFAVPVLFIAMIVPHASSSAKASLHTHVIGDLSAQWLVLCILATPVQFYVGARYYRGSYHALKAGGANMDVLIAIGTSTAYVYSAVLVVANMFSAGFDGDQYFETSAMLITIIVLGEYIKESAKGRTSDVLHKLLDLQPDTAILLSPSPPDAVGADGVTYQEERILSTLLEAGDVVKVFPGAKIPCDGVIDAGISSVDESMVTGESLPVDKTAGDDVIGGTQNHSGLLIVRATGVGQDSTLAKIVQLIEDAQSTKAPVHALADTISAYFVPAVCTVALLAFVVWVTLAYTVLPDDYPPDGMSRFLFALLFFVTTVVIACPCALGLATPAAVMVGTGLGAAYGVLIKGGEALERAHQATAIVFDKTGTLTTGDITVTDVVVSGNAAMDMTRERLLELAGRAETGSDHPISRAIVACATATVADRVQLGCDAFTATTGKGVVCTVEGCTVRVGNVALMADGAIVTDNHVLHEQSRLQCDGKTVVLVAVDGQIAGMLAMLDTIRPEAASVVSALTHKGVDVWMVTGDNARTAASIARQAGIANVQADALPRTKAEIVSQLQAQGHVVGVVGDGINDAPALTQADVGFAIGAGTEIAIESADVVLMKSNLYDVLVALDISAKTYQRIKLNLLFAFFYNTIAIPYATGLFYPLTKRMLPPWVAGIAMVLSSITVVSSSLALRLYRNPYTPFMHNGNDADTQAKYRQASAITTPGKSFGISSVV